MSCGLSRGEGFEIEFKEGLNPEKIARALSAFANTKGGYVLFGVDDDGSIIGVESEKSEVDLIQHAGRTSASGGRAADRYRPVQRKDVIVATSGERQQAPLLHGGEHGNATAMETARQWKRPRGGRHEGLHPRERQDRHASREVVKILGTSGPTPLAPI